MPRWVKDEEFFKYGRTCGQIRRAIGDLDLSRWTLTGFQQSVYESSSRIAKIARDLDDYTYVERRASGHCVWQVPNGGRLVR